MATIYMPVNSSSATTTQAKSAASTYGKYFYIRLYVTTSTSGSTATLTIRLQAYVNDTTTGTWSYNNCGTSSTYKNSKSIQNKWTTFNTKTATTSINPDGSYSYTFSASVTGPSGTSFASKSASISSRTQKFTDGPKGSFTITFVGNGGENIPSNQTKPYGSNITLSSVTPNRSGYEFMGWAENYADGSIYAPGSTFTRDANTSLCALWRIIPNAVPFSRRLNVSTVSDLTLASLGTITVDGVPRNLSNSKLSSNNPIRMTATVDGESKLIEVHVVKVTQEGDLYEKTYYNDSSLVYVNNSSPSQFSVDLSMQLMSATSTYVFTTEGMYLIRIGIFLQ